MRHIATLLLCIVAVSLSAREPWPGIEFTEVRAYAWPARIETDEVILKGMTLKPGVSNKAGAPLSAAQVRRLRAAVTGAQSQQPLAGCYIPHNAFVFYDAKKQPVAFVEVCFACLGHRIEPAGAAKHIDLFAIASIFTELHLPLGMYPDADTFKLKVEEMKKAHQIVREREK